MAAVTVSTTFRRGSVVHAFRIKPNGLESPLGSGVADANGTVTITGIPAGCLLGSRRPVGPEPSGVGPQRRARDGAQGAGDGRLRFAVSEAALSRSIAGNPAHGKRQSRERARDSCRYRA
jgi:hypothetical protein